jgi:death-on-curing protein
LTAQFHPTNGGQSGAKLLEGIARAQAFVDGNKRIAWLSMIAFLHVNGLTLEFIAAEEVEAAVLESHEMGIDRLTHWVAVRLIPLV